METLAVSNEIKCNRKAVTTETVTKSRVTLEKSTKSRNTLREQVGRLDALVPMHINTSWGEFAN